MAKFEKKSAEELAKMEPTAIAEYMIAEQQAEKAELDSMIAGKASKEDVEAMQEKMEKSMLGRIDKLQVAMVEQGKFMRELSQQKEEKEPISLKSVLESNRGILKKIQSGEVTGMQHFNVEGVKDMTLAASINGQQIPQALRLPGYNELPLRPLSFLGTIPQESTVKNVIEWVYMATRTGAPAATAEAATKPAAEFTWNLGSETVAKYTGSARVSTEMLDDIDFMRDAINTDLLNRLLLQVESDAYSGSGAAGPPRILNGVRTVATAFAAPTGLAGAIDSANQLDVLSAAFTQITLAFQPAPTHIFMNPVDVALMRAYKVSTTDRRYVENLYETAEGLNFMGARIVPTPEVAQDDYLVGHMPFARLWNRQAPSLAIGLNGDDFRENMRTLLTEWRGAVVVKTNDRTAFVAGDFTTDIAALSV